MAFSQAKINDMYERALSCVDAEFADMPAGSGGKIAADGLRAAFDEIRAQDSAKLGFGDSAQVGTGQRSATRVSIRNYRSKLAETANIIARKKPGFNADFPPPSGETDNELISQTRAIAAKAIDKQADFIQRGLTLTYLQSVTAMVDAFEASLDTTNEASSHKSAAVGAKKSAYREADEHFDELDMYIRNVYADQPDKMNAWRVATHIERSKAKDEGDGEGEGENPPTP